MLAPIREKRKYYEQNPQLVWDILKQGTLKAKQKYEAVCKQLKQKLGIDYFE